MTGLDELIAELCPTGVGFKELGSLGRRNKGTAMTAAQMKALHVGGAPIRIFAGGNTVADLEEGAVPSASVILEPSIIVKSRGYIGFEYYAKPFSHKNELWSYTLTDPSVDQKFVYYYLLTRVPELQVRARATSVKLPQLSVSDTDRLRVPVPPLEVQREIVKILDCFTELEAELETELEARRRQYEYYRETLLGFDDAVPRVALGELLARGVNSRWASAEEEFQYIDLTSVDRVSHSIRETETITRGTAPSRAQQIVRQGDVLFGTTRPTLKRYCIVPSRYDGQIASTGFCVLRPDTNQLLTSFLFHILGTEDFYSFVGANERGASYPAIPDSVVKEYRIPLPSIGLQGEIATRLDCFDALANDLAIGLPAELKARRKQYEYYRDRLLTFSEAT